MHFLIHFYVSAFTAQVTWFIVYTLQFFFSPHQRQNTKYVNNFEVFFKEYFFPVSDYLFQDSGVKIRFFESRKKIVCTK